ncbi:hypothetical protein HHK36_005207 [Tetracentron sinense]|uniref:Malectin domain-containing protein n=1 Tax=Tetracentron sinense TaxID=13715 RepID=A0A834ZKR0_TETSI|nr:hypothetical protein HHK36_005207 [Tetracentron sinense]
MIGASRALLVKKYSLHINCGGSKTTIGNTTYESDEVLGGATKFYWTNNKYWGFSSTGGFWDHNRTNDDYMAKNLTVLSMDNSELYMTARLSPLSLTYYGRCLANGSYTVKLHFAEIIFRDDKNFSSLGRRIFDVYIQENLVLKDFNIENVSGGVDKEVIREFRAVVRDKTLEIRFQWVGKGTTCVPSRGNYGPLISAISMKSGKLFV